ncbi:MAG: type II toxin-antitoxin system Phd/YefM family antitoxin [Thermoguttaceae bacterium]
MATSMKYSERIRPISYLQANATEVVDMLADVCEPVIITQNGEAKAVLQDYDSYQQTCETLAMLKILALGNKQIEEGRVVSVDEAVRQIRKNRETV